MRHYVAAQRQSDRLWHYTCDARYPVGACASDCPGHATAEEAYAHERARILDEQIRFHPDNPKASSAHKCAACGVWTTGGAWVGQWFHVALCEAHRTREHVEPRFSVGESWES